MLSILSTPKNQKPKEPKESFGGDGYLYYLDFLMASHMSLYVQTHLIIYVKYKYMQFFVYKLYLHYVGKNPQDIMNVYTVFMEGRSIGIWDLKDGLRSDSENLYALQRSYG